MKKPLTDVGVRALTPPAKGQLTVWDSQSPVGVRVSQGGSKTFIVLIGPGKRQTIGRFGIISLAEARTEAKRILASKTLGLDKKPTSITFAVALPLYFADHFKDQIKRHPRNVKRLLETHFLPAFRSTSLADITDQEIGRLLDKLADRPSEQLHAFRALRTMLKWCTRPPRRYITHSPLEGYKPPGEDKKGKRILSDSELVKVWKACEGLFGSMVRLLILWGTRNGETARTQRTWIERGVLTIPGEYTKNKRAHSIPLLPIARSILHAQKTNSGYFFPGRVGDSHFNDGSWGKMKKELDKRSGVKNYQLRDIRRTFRSNMAKLKISREICEILLNHVTGAGKNELDEIYDRYTYLDEKREALAKWENRLSTLLKAA